MSRHKFLGLGILFVMVFSFVVVPLAPNTVSSAQSSSSSCPSTDTLHWTLNGGVPNSFTSLIEAVYSGYEMSWMQWLSAYAVPGPTGFQYQNYSITNFNTHNSNYTQWSFNVRPGLKWSNGQPINASDILATYGPNYAFNASYDFTGIHSEVLRSYAANASEAVFVLNKSDPWFPLLISQVVFVNIVPASEIAQYGPNYNGFGSPVVDGPFMAVNYTAGNTQAVLKPNPYWSTIGLPNPKVCQIDVNFVESDTSADTLLQEGATDLAPVDPGAAQSVLSNPNVHILSLQAAEIQQLTYNITAYPMNMTNFRQAIVYAVNQSQIVQQAVKGYAAPAYTAEGIVPNSVTALYNPNQQNYSYSPTTASQLLSAIGFKKGSNGQLDYPNGTAVTLNIMADTEHTIDVQAAGIMQTDLQALGITVNTQIVARSVIAAAPSEVPGTLYLTTGEAPVFPSAYIDALPGWDVYTHPAIATKYWEYPPHANDLYNGNFSALSSTDNTTLVNQYLNNIQALNAQYLPVIVLSYPDFLWGYSTQNFVGWGSYPQNFISQGNVFDFDTWINLAPTHGSTTTSSNQTSPVTTTSTGSTGTTTGVPPVTTTTATSAGSSTSSTSGANNTYLYAGIAIVVIIIIAAAAALMMRRRKV
jgi:peptide/nickel transport system substrate-binding protein